LQKKFYGARIERAGAVAQMDENENAQRGKLFKGEKPGEYQRTPHHLYKRQLSEHRGMLESWNGHFYDFGEHLYPQMQILFGSQRKTTST
jgi:hypothetical protein